MSDIDVGVGWRRLMPGEVLQNGDQWLSHSERNVWLDTSAVGERLGKEDRPYRRRHSPEVAALTADLSALVARVEKIEAANTDDARREWVEVLRERDEARAECKKLSAANYALDGVVTALESRVSDLKKELKLAKEANAGGFSKHPAASGAGKSAEGGNQEPVKYAVVVGGEMKNTVYDNFDEARYKASEIACRGVPHFVGVVALYRETPRPRVKAPVCPIARDGNASQCQGSGWDMAAEAFKKAILDAGYFLRYSCKLFILYRLENFLR